MECRYAVGTLGYPEDKHATRRPVPGAVQKTGTDSARTDTAGVMAAAEWRTDSGQRTPAVAHVLHRAAGT